MIERRPELSGVTTIYILLPTRSPVSPVTLSWRLPTQRPSKAGTPFHALFIHTIARETKVSMVKNESDDLWEAPSVEPLRGRAYAYLRFYMKIELQRGKVAHILGRSVAFWPVACSTPR
jgi:hypothetical protein